MIHIIYSQNSYYHKMQKKQKVGIGENYEITNNYDEAFDQYIKFGGMSGSYEYKAAEKYCEYIRNVYSTVKFEIWQKNAR